MAGRTYFIADLHLCESRPRVTERFYRFLEETAQNADALYILGDLFETWVGDDDQVSPLHHETAKRLQHLNTLGVPVLFMHGNRDFLLAGRYAGLCGMKLLADPTLIDLYGTSTLLMHGDTLCTGDTAYLAFRQQVRDFDWQQAFLAQPLAARKAQAMAARAQSESVKQEKSAEIMDVDAEEVARVLARHAYPRLIHGHTHRPAQHRLSVDGHECERWVVPDWYARWGYVVCSSAGCELVVNPL